LASADQMHEFARGLMASGKFASLSAVVQHGLRLVEREQEEHRARLDAIRADLGRRAAQAPISLEQLDEQLALWRAARDTAKVPIWRDRAALQGRSWRRRSWAIWQPLPGMSRVGCLSAHWRTAIAVRIDDGARTMRILRAFYGGQDDEAVLCTAND
jgi:antitoxin ParD1/3/4